MGIKNRFRNKQTPASKPVDVRSVEESEPVMDGKTSRNTDDDTASSESWSSYIYPNCVNSPEHQREEEINIVVTSGDYFLSTLCCHGGSLPGDEEHANDIKDGGKEILAPALAEADLEEEEEGVVSKIASTFLYMIGQAPPVQIIRCVEDMSVDQSEVSLPQVLTDMAEEYDESRRRIEAQDKTLKEQYERQQKEQSERKLSRRMMKIPLRSSKGYGSHRSSSATVASSSTFFSIRKKTSFRPRHNKMQSAPPILEF